MIAITIQQKDPLPECGCNLLHGRNFPVIEQRQGLEKVMRSMMFDVDKFEENERLK